MRPSWATLGLTAAAALCALAAAIATPARGAGRVPAVADAQDATGALDLTAASLRQDGGRLELRLSTEQPWALDELVRIHHENAESSRIVDLLGSLGAAVKSGGLHV